MDKRVCLVLSATFLCNLTAHAQQTLFTEAQMSRSICFVVVVADRFGRPVTDLRQQDFTVFDNNSIRPIMAFKAITGTKRQDEGSPFMLAATMLSATATDALRMFPRYEITFDPAIARRSNEYHQVKIRVDKPDLKVVTSDVYYAQPN
jgi:hypothetical protein